MGNNEELKSAETQQWLEKYFYNNIGYTSSFFDAGEVPYINETARLLMESALMGRLHPYSDISNYLENPQQIDDGFEQSLDNFKLTSQKVVRVDDENFIYAYINIDIDSPDKYHDVIAEAYYNSEIKVDYITEFNNRIKSYLEKGNNLLLSEFSRCNNPYKYVNKVAEYIIDEYSTCKKKLYIHPESNNKYRPFYRILSNQYRKIMEHIINEYPSDLKTSLYNELIYRTRKKEEVKSFKLKGNYRRIYRSRHFESDFSKFKKKNLIAKDTSFQTFCELFEGKLLVEKICWSDTISSLYTFVQLLVGKDKDISKIEPTMNKHWEITASCFTLNNVNLDRSDFPNLHHIKDTEIKRFFRSFIKNL